MDWSSVDATAIYVALLVVSLTLVWAYVLLRSGNKTDLGQSSSKEAGPGARKANRGRGRGRQVSHIGLYVVISTLQ